MLRVAAACVFLAVWGSPALPVVAAPVTMRAEVDRRTCTLDDAIVLTVTLTFAEQNIQTGALSLPPTPDFEVGGQQSMEQVSLVNGVFTANRITRITLLPAREGKLTVPPIRNFYVDPASGNRVELETPPIDVTVTKAPEPAAKPKRDAPLEPAIPSGTPFSGAAAIILATVALVALLSFALARYLKAPAAPAASPVFDLKVERNEAAEAIRRDARRDERRPARDAEWSRERLALLAREDERLFAREVSRLLKAALERSSTRPFAGATSDEIREAIGFLRLGGEAREHIEALLDYADGVNYRGEGAPVEGRDAIIDRLRRLAELLNNEDRR